MKHEKRVEFNSKMKVLANEIKTLKRDYRNAMKTKGDYWGAQVKCAQMRREFRHRHVALCMLRGKPYERIETATEGNLISWALLAQYTAEYKALLDGQDAESARTAGRKAGMDFPYNHPKVVTQNNSAPPPKKFSLGQWIKSLFQ